VTSRQGKLLWRPSEGHLGDYGVTPKVTPFLRSGEGPGDPVTLLSHKFLRKEERLPGATRRSSRTQGHRHPASLPKELVLGLLAGGLLSEHRHRLPSLPGLSICRRFTDSMVTVIASGSSRR
jgi:hypothetical protein